MASPKTKFLKYLNKLFDLEPEMSYVLSASEAWQLEVYLQQLLALIDPTENEAGND